MKRPATFTLDIASGAGRAHVPYLRRHLPRARAMIRTCRLAELSLALVGDAVMSALHRRFMGLDGPTDVLTFPLDADERGRPTSGEVVVCVDEARRRARELGHPVERELLLYALHGMLHLSGHDDTTPAGFQRMHRAEDRILRRLGVGAVFASAPGRRRTEDRRKRMRDGG